MRKLVLLAGFILISAGLLSSCHSYRDSSKPLEAVDNLDLDRFAGLWHEVARYPTRFQRDCTRSSAEYSVNTSMGGLDLKNTCWRHNGETRSIEGEASRPNESEPGKLKVRFDSFPASLFESNYWVIDLGADYEYAVVSEPRGRYLWILSREPHLDQLVMEDILQSLSIRGFDTSQLIFPSNISIYSFRKR